MLRWAVLSTTLQTMGREQGTWEAASLLSLEVHDFKIQGRFVALADLSCQYTVDFWLIFYVG